MNARQITPPTELYPQSHVLSPALSHPVQGKEEKQSQALRDVNHLENMATPLSSLCSGFEKKLCRAYDCDFGLHPMTVGLKERENADTHEGESHGKMEAETKMVW